MLNNFSILCCEMVDNKDGAIGQNIEVWIIFYVIHFLDIISFHAVTGSDHFPPNAPTNGWTCFGQST